MTTTDDKKARRKTTGIAAATLAAGIALGGIGHAQFARQLPTSARPVTLRFLNEGPDKPVRFALSVEMTAGAAIGQREIVCENDGSGPKLNGVDDPSSLEICGLVAGFGNAVTPKVAARADALVELPAQP